jgi:hypothetical protein
LLFELLREDWPDWLDERPADLFLSVNWPCSSRFWFWLLLPWFWLAMIASLMAAAFRGVSQTAVGERETGSM